MDATLAESNRMTRGSPGIVSCFLVIPCRVLREWQNSGKNARAASHQVCVQAMSFSVSARNADHNRYHCNRLQHSVHVPMFCAYAACMQVCKKSNRQTTREGKKTSCQSSPTIPAIIMQSIYCSPQKRFAKQEMMASRHGQRDAHRQLVIRLRPLPLKGRAPFSHVP